MLSPPLVRMGRKVGCGVAVVVAIIIEEERGLQLLLLSSLKRKGQDEDVGDRKGR